MITHNYEFDMIIRGIVATRGEEGATIAEMRDDYFEIVCEKWPLQGVHHRAIIGYLTELEGLVMVRVPNGPCIWYVDDLGNVSERLNQHQCDANNNDIITVSDASTGENVIEISSNSNSTISYVLPTAPSVQSTSSSLNGFNPLPSTTITDTSADVQENDKSRKRHISFGSSQESFYNDTKRPRNKSFDRINLIEENLEIHNFHVGSNGMCTKTTSTEVECSSSINQVFNANGFPNGYHSNGSNGVDCLDR